MRRAGLSLLSPFQPRKIGLGEVAFCVKKRGMGQRPTNKSTAELLKDNSPEPKFQKELQNFAEMEMIDISF